MPQLEISKNKNSLEKKNEILLKFALVESMSSIDIAGLLSDLEPSHILEILMNFSPQKMGSIFSEFPITTQLNLFSQFSHKKFATIFQNMPSDEQADFFQNLSPEEQENLLPFLPQEQRADIIKLSAYPPETAGGIMTTDLEVVYQNMTCAEAIEKIRKDAPSKRIIYNIYVLGDKAELTGYITLADLIISDPSELVQSVMNAGFAFGYLEEDREVIARKIEKYDLAALPILNANKQLVGVVTHDDAMDVIQAEQTEDMEKFMGIIPGNEDANYLETSCWQHFQKRVVWIVSLAVVGIISGMIIHHFENALEKLLILALYMPMVADTGGNSGSQAATVVIRALALGQITVGNWLRILWKEAKIGILLASCLGILAFFKVLFLSWETVIPESVKLSSVAIIIALALSLQVIGSTIIGASLPLIVRKFGGDPAVAASPAITTIVDITGLLIYFSLATSFFGL